MNTECDMSETIVDLADAKVHWQDECHQRRCQLLDAMQPDSMAIIFSEPDKRSNNVERAFQVNKDIWYLSGFAETPSIIVLLKQSTTKYILFSRQKDAAKERWDGLIVGQMGALEMYGADEAYPMKVALECISKWLQTVKTVYLSDYLLSCNFLLTDCMAEWQEQLSDAEIVDLDSLLHEMRRIKSPIELQLMQHANDISIAAHYSIMAHCKPGINEAELEALFYYECMRRGGRFQAYDPIIASGNAATILHYLDNNSVCRDGDLLLVDAGSKFHYYSSDITRTFPVNGRFTSRQADLYNVVLEANKAVIEMVRPGITLGDMQQKTIKLLTEGLCALGLLQGEVDSLIELKAYVPFYMHSVSHSLGLDTHDVGKIRQDDLWFDICPHMVITVEPGLYIPEGTKNVDPAWWGMGIRVEDDVVVTETDGYVMSEDLVKSVTDIEEVMN